MQFVVAGVDASIMQCSFTIQDYSECYQSTVAVRATVRHGDQRAGRPVTKVLSWRVPWNPHDDAPRQVPVEAQDDCSGSKHPNSACMCASSTTGQLSGTTTAAQPQHGLSCTSTMEDKKARMA
jgi:hypothetical protein